MALTSPKGPWDAARGLTRAKHHCPGAPQASTLLSCLCPGNSWLSTASVELARPFRLSRATLWSSASLLPRGCVSAAGEPLPCTRMEQGHRSPTRPVPGLLGGLLTRPLSCTLSGCRYLGSLGQAELSTLGCSPWAEGNTQLVVLPWVGAGTGDHPWGAPGASCHPTGHSPTPGTPGQASSTREVPGQLHSARAKAVDSGDLSLSRRVPTGMKGRCVPRTSPALAGPRRAGGGGGGRTDAVAGLGTWPKAAPTAPLGAGASRMRAVGFWV